MTSRIVSLFNLFQRGNAAAASAGTNSWATVSLWRRFFELKEQEKQEECESFAQIVEEVYDVKTFRPIESEEAIKARRQMVAEYHRGLRNGRTSSSGNRVDSNDRNESIRNVSGDWRNERHEDNLDIPVGDYHVTLAQ